MTGKRIAVAGLGAAVLAAVVFLAISATSSNADKQKSKVRMTEATGKTEIVEPPAVRRKLAKLDPGSAVADAETDEGTDGFVEYIKDDGTVVRDHRGSEQEIVVRKVAGTTDIKVRRDVRPLFKECGKQLRSRDRRARGRVQAVMTTSIRNGRIKVDALDLQVEGLDDSSYTDCVREQVEGLELYAPDGQDDVEKHTMTIQFKVP